MRLFLSSYRAGGHETELKKLIGDVRSVGVVTNAKDYKTASERKESVDEVFDFFRSTGIEAKEIDLRPYFHKTGSEKELEKFQFIWLAGGNTFILRKALTYSGADKWLTNKVHKNEIIFGGESAGAILATPNFTGVEFGDDPNIVPAGYKKEIIRDGLNFVPFCIVPHYKSAWTGAEEMIEALKAKKLKYKVLTDDQAILINDKEEKLLS